MDVQVVESQGHTPPSYRFSQEALAIEEILGHIMLFVDRGSKASSIRVSKCWFECTVKKLWDQVNIIFAMRLLAPLQVPPGNPINRSYRVARFSRPLLPENWERFSIYAAHVKIICSPKGLGYTDVVSAMARSRRVLYMFPNLREIRWHAKDICQLEDSIPYMSPHVTTFCLTLEDVPQEAPNLEAFYRETASRLPQLKILSISMHFMTSELKVPLTLLINELKFLEKYVTPRCTLTMPVLLALSRLPRLRSIIGFPGYTPPIHAQITEVETLEPEELAEGAFSSLIHLELSTNFSNISHLLKHPHRPQSLVTLFCDSIHHEFPEDIRTLLMTIATACPMLKSLILNVGAYLPEFRHNVVCNFDSLRPILQCRSLTSLIIGGILQLELTEEGMVELARDRDTWTQIVLRPWNTALNSILRPTLGLSAIIPFMRYCPHLKTLGLFLDGDSPVPEIEHNNAIIHPHPLTTLKLGKSPISEESADAVVLFLARICVRPVEIETEPSQYPVWKRVQKLHSGICDVLDMHNENARKSKQVKWEL